LHKKSPSNKICQELSSRNLDYKVNLLQKLLIRVFMAAGSIAIPPLDFYSVF